MEVLLNCGVLYNAVSYSARARSHIGQKVGHLESEFGLAWLILGATSTFQCHCQVHGRSIWSARRLPSVADDAHDEWDFTNTVPSFLLFPENRLATQRLRPGTVSRQGKIRGKLRNFVSCVTKLLSVESKWELLIIPWDWRYKKLAPLTNAQHISGHIVSGTVQSWPKKVVMGCVNSPPRPEAGLRNLGKTCLAISVPYVSVRIWKGCVYPSARPEAPRTQEHATIPYPFWDIMYSLRTCGKQSSSQAKLGQATCLAGA